MTDYYIDRDPRPKSHPCRYCGRDVQERSKCIFAPSECRDRIIEQRTYQPAQEPSSPF